MEYVNGKLAGIPIRIKMVKIPMIENFVIPTEKTVFLCKSTYRYPLRKMVIIKHVKKGPNESDTRVLISLQ